MNPIDEDVNIVNENRELMECLVGEFYNTVK